MTQHLINSTSRFLALGIAGVSAAAMFYIGLYQTRAVTRIWCPIFRTGCEAVADADFARRFGIPDGYLAGGLYLAMILLLLTPVEKAWVWTLLFALALLATLANIAGIRDMAVLGSFCFYCVATTVLSPILLWLVWRLK